MNKDIRKVREEEGVFPERTMDQCGAPKSAAPSAVFVDLSDGQSVPLAIYERQKAMFDALGVRATAKWVKVPFGADPWYALEGLYAALRNGAAEDRTKAWELHAARKFSDGAYYLGRCHARDKAAGMLLPILLGEPAVAPEEASPPRVSPPIRDAKP